MSDNNEVSDSPGQSPEYTALELLEGYSHAAQFAPNYRLESGPNPVFLFADVDQPIHLRLSSLFNNLYNAREPGNVRELDDIIIIGEALIDALYVEKEDAIHIDDSNAFVTNADSIPAEPVQSIVEQLRRVLHTTFTAHYTRYKASPTEDAVDLDQAIALCHKIFELPVPDDSLAAEHEHFCEMLLDKYHQNHDVQTIAEAIEHGRASLRGEQNDNPNYLLTLARAYRARAHFHDTPQDADNSMRLMHLAAASARAHNWPAVQIAVVDNDLCQSYREKLDTTVEPNVVVEEYVNFCRKIVAETPSTVGPHIVLRYNLARALERRFDTLEDQESLDESIAILEGLVEEVRENVKFRTRWENDLSDYLCIRAQHTGSAEDYRKSLEYAHKVLDEPFVPADQSLAATKNLAEAYINMWKLHHEVSDLNLASKYCSEVIRQDSYVSFGERIKFSIMWAAINRDLGHLDVAVNEGRRSVHLYSRFRMVGRSYNPKKVHERWNELGSTNASLALSNGMACDALEIIETGRSFGWSRALQMRVKLGNLETDHPQYAKQFKELSQALENGELSVLTETSALQESSSMDQVRGTSGAPGWERNTVLSKQWDDLLANIRKLDGYETFLSDPHYDQLKTVAYRGPVVVYNISERRSDALILTVSSLDRPQIVRLSDTLHESTKSWSESLLQGIEAMSNGVMTEQNFGKHVLRPILQDLWDEVVLPVRQTLRWLAPYTRRIWWCPTGRLVFLPLHFVTNGILNQDIIENSLLPIIPSYALTLSTLLRARSSLKNDRSAKLLAVCCEKPRGTNHKRIRGTGEEIQALSAMSGCLVSTILESENATVDHVLQNVTQHAWLHFACHGIQDSNEPYRSHFVLKDGPLHMADIISTRLDESAEFAFLSACHTATGIESLSDEAMHLAAGLHFVGFSGMIATMWSVHDKTATKLAKEVYMHLLRKSKPNVEEAAEALWIATSKLRSEGIPVSRLVPFIHMGV